jgi:hypothetical protein
MIWHNEAVETDGDHAERFSLERVFRDYATCLTELCSHCARYMQDTGNAYHVAYGPDSRRELVHLSNLPGAPREGRVVLTYTSTGADGAHPVDSFLESLARRKRILGVTESVAGPERIRCSAAGLMVVDNPDVHPELQRLTWIHFRHPEEFGKVTGILWDLDPSGGDYVAVCDLSALAETPADELPGDLIRRLLRDTICAVACPHDLPAFFFCPHGGAIERMFLDHVKSQFRSGA